MKKSAKDPIVVNPLGLMGATIQDGEYQGLPYALAAAIGQGLVTREDVAARGWRFADCDEAAAMVAPSAQA
jgi:hypothetical protein